MLPALLLLLASPSHAAKPFCGDGQAKGSEQCDGADLDGQTCQSLGFDSGELACDASCAFDTSGCESAATATCGDGLVEGYEECDGASDAACPGACSAHCACPATGVGDLEIHVIDVGQGDGILMISPDGFAALFDAGTDGQWSTIQSYMTSIGLSSLDYTVVSHMDADHVGGMDGVLAAFPEVVACFDHGGSHTTAEYSEYDAAAGDRRTTLSEGGFIDMGPSMTVEVLHAHQSSGAENNNSNVLKLSYGANTALIGGDCEAACEASYDPGPTQIYKVHHHGSSDSSSQAFLDAMQPETALISVGAGNAFGHPDTETLDRLSAVGATVYRTDLDGDLAVVIDGAAYTVNGAATCSEAETRSCGETDVGECAYGVETCSGGAWGSCAGEVGPAPEVCDDGLDNDCDGATDAADLDCAVSSEQILLVQVAYDTPGTDSVEEFVDLYNPTGADVPLDGWSLTDNAGTWSFPTGATLAAGGYLSLARDAAGFEALYGLLPDLSGLTLSLNNGGDVLILADDLGAEVDRLAWEGYEAGWSVSAGTGDSLERIPHDVDTDAPDDWTTTSPAAPLGGSPGGDTGDTGAACGDGICDADESCDGRGGTIACAADCPGVVNGKPANRYCYVGGTCEGSGCP